MKKRNIHGFSNQYKPPSRTITNYPTTEEIQQKLQAAMQEKQQLTETEIPEWKKTTNLHPAAADVIPFHESDEGNVTIITDFDIHNRLLPSHKRVSIDKTAAEKLPPMIRNIVTRVAENDDNFATASLPAEFNPNIPPPMLPTTTVSETRKKDFYDPITPVQALLRKYSVDDGTTKAETRACYPDKNVREQHQKQLDRNRRGEANRLDDNCRRQLSFNTVGMLRQPFSFKYPIIACIFEHLKPEHLIKLYQCCKCFYDKFRRNIIRHLEIVRDGEKETLDPTKTVICVSNDFLLTLQDFWLTDSYTNHGGFAVLPELFHCCIKKLESSSGIEWSEYKKLAKAGTIEELNIGECRFFPTEYGTLMFAPVESIIAEVPNAKSIEISNADFIEGSCEAFLKLNRNVKFSKFVLRNITPHDLFKYQLFKEFILKSADPECHVQIDCELLDEDVVEARELYELLDL
uniref:F-box domain-containing protein n=1 Tax=Panagrolaimus davidi TaxID=227884 RepID=A0A914Q2U4_9BILA